MNGTKIILNRCQVFHSNASNSISARALLHSRPRYRSSQRSPDLLAGFGEKGRETRKRGRREVDG